MLGALADIEDVLQTLLLRKGRQDGSTGDPLEATSTLEGITAPTSCAAFTEMVNQVIAMSYFGQRFSLSDDWDVIFQT